jgi:DNA-binding MarR family transcriptional regulator
MSTRSAPTIESTPAAASAQPDETTTQLVQAVQSFVDAFVRWSKANAAASGPSLSRLRLLNTLHCEGALKMADLAEALGVTPRNVTALVDALEEDGLVHRFAHQSDRRVTMIELTDKAPDAAELFAAHQAAIAGLCSVMNKREQRDYLRLTRRLDERLRNAQTLSS